MSEISTPRTDANQQTWDRANEGGCSADFARTLERELQAVTALAQTEIDAFNAELATLRTQLAERHEAMAEQDRVNLELRKSLEVAEAKAEDHVSPTLKLRNMTACYETVEKERDDLRRQLTEAQEKYAGLYRDCEKRLTEKQNENTDLLKRLADAEKDRERMDWLESDEGFAVITNITAEEVLRRDVARKVSEVSVRYAIDAARTQPKP